MIVVIIALLLTTVASSAGGPPPALPPPATPTPTAPPAPARIAAAAPTTPGEELARYRLRFGVIGDVGEIVLRQRPAQGAETVARLSGMGRGSVLGMGMTEKRIESLVDPRTGASRRWTNHRIVSGKPVTDFAQQPAAGTVSMTRRRPGKPDHSDTLQRKVPVLDPLAFLTQVRMSPLTASATYEVLDGRGLWVITMRPAVAEGGKRPSLRLQGRAVPIFWDGSRDGERKERPFTVWLSADEYRVPLRLVMPMGIGEVRADLVSVTRGQPSPRLERALSGNPTGRTMLQAMTAGQ